MVVSGPDPDSYRDYREWLVSLDLVLFFSDLVSAGRL